MMCALVVASTAAAATARAEDSSSAEARTHFDTGVALLQDQDGARYEDAYREFRAAYAISRSSRILGNVGFCAMKLERDQEAIDAYARYLTEVGDIDPVEREQMRRDLTTLRAGVVRMTVTVDPPNAQLVDVRKPVRGDPVSNVYVADRGRITLGLRPGQHMLRARVEGRESTPWDVDAAPGTALQHAFSVPPPEALSASTPAPPSRALPVATMGLGAALLAAGGVMGYLAFRSVDSISTACPDGVCPATYDLEAQQKKAHFLATGTDAFLIGGGVFVLGGLTWLLLQGNGSSHERQPATRAAVGCTGTACVAAWGGRF